MCQAEEAKAAELVLKYQIWGGLLLSTQLEDPESSLNDEEMKSIEEGENSEAGGIVFFTKENFWDYINSMKPGFWLPKISSGITLS